MRRLPTAGFVPLVLLVAACGGGSGAAGVSSPPASPDASVAASPSTDASGEGSAGASVDGSAGASGATACAPSNDDPAVDIAIADFAFDPAEATASVGDAVGWTNNDSAPHSAVFGDAGCGTEVLADGDSGALVFNEPGTYEYVCGIHPAMKGKLEVAG